MNTFSSFSAGKFSEIILASILTFSVFNLWWTLRVLEKIEKLEANIKPKDAQECMLERRGGM